MGAISKPMRKAQAPLKRRVNPPMSKHHRKNSTQIQPNITLQLIVERLISPAIDVEEKDTLYRNAPTLLSLQQSKLITPAILR